MKILQVGSSLYDWGGIERYICYLAEGLIGRGHEVEVICPPGSPLDQKCPGIHHHFSLRGQFDLASISGFKNFFREHRYDVVHVHYSPDFVIPARAAKSSGALIMTRHLANPWNRLKSRAYLSTFDHVIAVSSAVRESLISQSRVPEDRVSVAHAGCPPVDTPQDREGIRAKLEVEGFAVGFFGRLTVEKGVDALLNAIPQLESGVSVHIFGSGPQEAELRAMPSAASAKFHGYITDVGEAMAAMDLIVVPSTWAEAFPFSVLEAMSAGRPVVASRVGGIPEQVADGVTGLLVPPGEPLLLANAINMLAKDSEMGNRLGSEGRKRAIAEYSVSAFAERIEAVYDAVLARKGTQARINGL